MSARKSTSPAKTSRAGASKQGKAKPKVKAPAPKAKSKPKAEKPAPAKRVRKASANGSASSKGQDSVVGGAVVETWTLRLYVTGRGERSESALRNLRKLCEQSLAEGSYQIEVIDLLKNPELAKADQILAIPTLVRKLPEPMKRIIGDLSNADRALLSLDFPSLTDAKAKRSPEATS